MKQIIVNVGGLTIEEKQRVNEALAKIRNKSSTPKVTNMKDVKWFYADAQIAWSYGDDSWFGRPATHTPQQALEMAGITPADEQIFLADTLIITDSSGNIIYDATPDSSNNFIKQRASAGKGEALPDSGVSVKLDKNGAAVLAEKRKERKGHVHAESMALYAEDAKSHAEPWKLWEFKCEGGWWSDCSHHPYWGSATEFRRKPKTHTVNGVEIPVFDYTPKAGDRYYVANVGLPEFFENGCRSQGDCTFTQRMIERGLLYPYTEDGKRAAILHSKAMLGIA